MGIFNPRQWGLDSETQIGKNPELQMRIKKMLLQWVYPGLKDAEENEFNALFQKMSVVKPNSVTSNSALSLFNKRLGLLGNNNESDFSPSFKLEDIPPVPQY